MNGDHHNHEIFAKPPQAICDAYKKYQRMKDAAVDDDLDVVDFTRGLTPAQKEKILPVGVVDASMIGKAEQAFKAFDPDGQQGDPITSPLPNPCTVYEHKDFEGLRLYPALLPPESQWLLVDKLLHRELSNPFHKTNIQADYTVPYPAKLSEEDVSASFFSYSTFSRQQNFTPLDPQSKNKPMNTTQFLVKKLRWLTIGDQYDWNTRSYSEKSPTSFPRDINRLVTGLFPNQFTPESGVILLYSPKDYMPVHRDVSEECQRGLASFSLGCDGLFIIARDKHTEVDENDDEREQDMVVLRVRSGDVVQMAGKTRFAWHGMPKVIAGTCPELLEDWPAREGVPKEYEQWKGYMKGKRLNISCRQVWDDRLAQEHA